MITQIALAVAVFFIRFENSFCDRKAKNWKVMMKYISFLNDPHSLPKSFQMIYRYVLSCLPFFIMLFL